MFFFTHNHDILDKQLQILGGICLSVKSLYLSIPNTTMHSFPSPGRARDKHFCAKYRDTKNDETEQLSLIKLPFIFFKPLLHSNNQYQFSANDHFI